ncbi:hypothetical protein [Candidatus Hydrogenosomobacter endosymbioticus]|uniref:Uncharacterized protein n=1 Tax=Candidatus Hydrogenosomobacter endosymbioticus TaxID=2558174 RepID=A0ABM7V928_9PROT|nr:hypothetical protein [Candidatus Hydrogenosomobacter endosymbioticus]BDB95993.1 hypothetical protein HYD_1260 [Candidatus Hydrogenosomobacter endosymbioticus]
MNSKNTLYAPKHNIEDTLPVCDKKRRKVIEKSGKNTKSEALCGFVSEIEDLFHKAMETGKLSVALKAKEMLAKIKGLFQKKTSDMKPVSQWSDDEIQAVIDELEQMSEEAS